VGTLQEIYNKQKGELKRGPAEIKENKITICIQQVAVY